MHCRTLRNSVVTAARDSARRAIEDAEIICLSLEDQSLITEALAHPPEPAEALRRAFQGREVLFGSTGGAEAIVRT